MESLYQLDVANVKNICTFEITCFPIRFVVKSLIFVETRDDEDNQKILTIKEVIIT